MVLGNKGEQDGFIMFWIQSIPQHLCFLSAVMQNVLALWLDVSGLVGRPSLSLLQEEMWLVVKRAEE